MEKLISATPSELLSMNSSDLFEAILKSEGRTLSVVALPVSPNFVDFVSNAEMVAAFGADIVILDNFNPDSPSISGLPSKDVENKGELKEIQISEGYGYSVKEIRELIGRPVSTVMVMTDGMPLENYTDATPENAKKLIASGSNIVSVANWLDDDHSLRLLREIKNVIQGKALLEYFRHNRAMGNKSYLCRPEEILAPDEIERLIEAGVDIINIPAPGTLPGFSLDLVSNLVNIVHQNGKLASLGIYNSIEGTNIDTLLRIAYESKVAGADIHELGASGFRVSMIDPQAIMAYSTSIKGIRHTYRRMATSIYR